MGKRLNLALCSAAYIGKHSGVSVAFGISHLQSIYQSSGVQEGRRQDSLLQEIKEEGKGWDLKPLLPGTSKAGYSAVRAWLSFQ